MGSEDKLGLLDAVVDGPSEFGGCQGWGGVKSFSGPSCTVTKMPAYLVLSSDVAYCNRDIQFTGLLGIDAVNGSRAGMNGSLCTCLTASTRFMHMISARMLDVQPAGICCMHCCMASTHTHMQHAWLTACVMDGEDKSQKAVHPILHFWFQKASEPSTRCFDHNTRSNATTLQIGVLHHHSAPLPLRAQNTIPARAHLAQAVSAWTRKAPAALARARVTSAKSSSPWPSL